MLDKIIESIQNVIYSLQDRKLKLKEKEQEEYETELEESMKEHNKLREFWRTFPNRIRKYNTKK